MNVLIVENEKPAVIGLKNTLAKLNQEINIAGITESVESTINWLQNNDLPDLIFMDIQLDDGLCFEIFEAIKIDVPVIFTTAFNEYMLPAFKVNSVDYLLKPVEKEPLQQAVTKFKSIHFRKNIGDEILNTLLQEVEKSYKTRFLVKIGSNFKSIPINDICLFYVMEGAAFIKTNSNKDYALDYSLDRLQKMIDPLIYFRINRNNIVNIHTIIEMVGYSSSRLKLKLSCQVPMEDLIVSKDKVREFKKWIDK